MDRVRFTWDPRKSEWNLRKRGFDSETAKLVFFDPHLQIFEDRVVHNEERLHAIGYVPGRGILVVTHTYEQEDEEHQTIRIISARVAERWEEGRYHKMV